LPDIFAQILSVLSKLFNTVFFTSVLLVMSICYSQADSTKSSNVDESVFVTEGDWNNPENWKDGHLPSSASKVIIEANVTLDIPSIVKELNINEDVFLTLKAFSSLSVKKNVYNNGHIKGDGELVLIGESAQFLKGKGSMNNLRLQNNSTVHVNDEMYIYGNLYVDAGHLLTKNNLYLKCDFETKRTAQVANVSGLITGEVIVEQCYPARRANRLISSSVNTSSSIRKNWQEDADSYNDDVPEGYGTHITGINPGNGPAYLDQDGENGFDYNPSGNASMFQFNNEGGGFTPIDNTNQNKLESGAPYMLLVRGDRTINIYSNTATPTPTRLRARGELVTGNYSTSDLSKSKNGFSLIGNPYHAQVDMNSVLAKSTNLRTDVYYVWDPKLGGVQNLNQEGGRGAFVVVELPSGSNSSNSEANQYLQPMQAAFVQTLSDEPATQINFSQDDIVVDEIQTEILSITEEHFMNIQLFNQVSFDLQSTPSDGLRINFKDTYSNTTEDDVLKLSNVDENLTRIADEKLVALERKRLPQGEEILPLYINQYRRENYVLNFQTSDSFPNQIYLIDHYLETETHITESDPTYYFNVEQSISGSFDENRFSLKLIPSSLSTSNPLLQQTKLYPNPTRGAFSINGLTDLRNSEVKIFNLMGQEVYALKLKSTSEVRITDFNASAGVYLVKLSSDQGERVFKLVKHH
jgi:hypothetical protein